MMQLRSESRRGELAVVPMINVAFLLLVFFLMTAVLDPADPSSLTLPEARSDTEAYGVTLSLDRFGTLSRADVDGEAVLTGLANQPVRLRVDAGTPGSDLARLLSQLTEAGVSEVDLVTVGR